MHFLLLPFLVLLAWVPSSRHEEQVDLRSTLLSTYPQLGHPAAPPRCYRYDGPITENFRLDRNRPDFTAILSQAALIDHPKAAEGYVEIVTISDREYFILQHHPATPALPDPGITAYRVLPGRVEMIPTWGKEQKLVENSIGITIWCYDYDEQGRIRRATTWCTMFDRRAEDQQIARELAASYADVVGTRLFRRPSLLPAMAAVDPVTEEIYDYWPTTGQLRSVIVIKNQATVPAAVRHFDESGHEIKQQP